MDNQTSRHTQSDSHEVYTAHLHRHTTIQTPPAALSTNVHLFRHPTPRHICTVCTSMSIPTSRHTQSGSHEVYTIHLHRHITIQTLPATLSTVVLLLRHPDRQTPLAKKLYRVHIPGHPDIQTHKVRQSSSVHYTSPPTHHHPDSPSQSVNHCTLQTPDTQTPLVPQLYSVHTRTHRHPDTPSVSVMQWTLLIFTDTPPSRLPSHSVNHCTLQTPDTQTPLVPQLYSVHIHEHTDIQTHPVWQSCSVRYSSPPKHQHPDSPSHSVNHCTPPQTPDTQTPPVTQLYSVHFHEHTDIQTQPVWQSCSVRYSSPPTHQHPDSPSHSVNHCTLQTPDTQTPLVPQLYSVHIHEHTDIQTSRWGCAVYTS